LIFVINYGGIYIQKTTRTLAIILALAAVIFACGCVRENSGPAAQNTTELTVTGTLENVTGEDGLPQYLMTLEIKNTGSTTITSNQAIGLFGPVEMGEKAIGRVREGETVIYPGDTGTVQFDSGNGTQEMLSYCSAERPPAFVVEYIQKEKNETRLLGTSSTEIPFLSEIQPGEKIKLQLKTEFTGQ